jgi:uncharacterized membrane protein YjjP (DUF1212 family)
VSINGQAIELLLQFTRLAHEAGSYPANALELRITGLAQAIGLDQVQVHASPTAVILTVGSIPNQHVYMLRVQPRPVDVDTICRLDGIAAAVTRGRVDCACAITQLEELSRHPLRRPLWLVVFACGLVGAAVAPILGGGWRESLGAAIVGFAVGLVTKAVVRTNRAAALVTPLGAFLASVLASAIAHGGFDIAVADVTFAALIIFLPGMPMVIGVRELASTQLQAGMANLANALMQLVGLVFGVAAGTSLAANLLGNTPLNTPVPLPGSVNIFAAGLVGLAFVVTLNAPARDAVWTCSAAVLAIVANHVSTEILGDIAGVFAAAVIIGVAGNVIVRRFHRSSLSFIVPGILMLVPVTIGYKSAFSLLTGEAGIGIDTAFQTFVKLLAIAYGLAVATIALSPGV